MEHRKVFDEREAVALKELLEERLHPDQKGEAGWVVESINRHRHGRIEAYGLKEERFQFTVDWATVRGKKYYSVTWRHFQYPFRYPSHFDVFTPGGPGWQKVKNPVFSAVAPEILERHKNMNLQYLYSLYKLDFRLREGKNRWGEPLGRNGMELKDIDGRLQSIVVRKNKHYYLVTRAGTFYAGFLPLDVPAALKYVFGLTGRQVRSVSGLVKEIEQQLELREKAQKILPAVPRGRIVEVDPAYGVIIDGVFYPVGEYPHGIRLPAWLQSIRKFLFALYGREIPERPDVLRDAAAPPWTLRRFGKPERAYLLDEDPERDLYVFVRYDRLYLGFGRKTFDVTRQVKKPVVPDAFRATFGIDLSPQATREDVEAIAAMATLGGN